MFVITTPVYERYLSALLAGDRAQCAAIVAELCAAGVEIKALYVHLFQRALYDVGERWETERISVAVEHLATAITERLIADLQARTPRPSSGAQSILVACVADEYHQLAGRMIADFCEMRGWRSDFLGANTPMPVLLARIEERRPTVVGLSLSVFANLPVLLRALAAVRQAHPDLPILAGGQAFRWGGIDAVQAFSGTSYVATLDDLEQRLSFYEKARP